GSGGSNAFCMESTRTRPCALEVQEVSVSHNPSKEDVYAKSRLSVVQSALWLNQKLQPDVPQFNSSVCFYFRGPLNTEQFQQAYQAYIDRTDCMRLVVVEEDGIPQPKFLDRVEYT